jgi:hypothetical protein
MIVIVSVPSASSHVDNGTEVPRSRQRAIAGGVVCNQARKQ